MLLQYFSTVSNNFIDEQINHKIIIILYSVMESKCIVNRDNNLTFIMSKRFISHLSILLFVVFFKDQPALTINDKAGKVSVLLNAKTKGTAGQCTSKY